MTPVEDLIQRITLAVNSTDPFHWNDDLAAQEWPTDPVARILDSPEQAQPATPIRGLAERESTVDQLSSTTQERELAEEILDQQTPGSSAQFQAAQAATMPEPKNWFAHWGGGPSGDLSGFIPQRALSPIEGGAHFMKPTAASAYKAMAKAARRDGVDFSITDSYRDYDSQVRLKAQKPSLAATPGHSNHGWGTALDINVNDPAHYQWLKENGKKFGFDQPMSYEPWHWEYHGGYKPKQQVQVQTRKPRRPSKPEPSAVTVDSMVMAPHVFGSVFGQALRPPQTPQEYEERQKKAGLGFVPQRYRKMVSAAAERFNLPARLIAAVMQHESGFNAKAVSSAGAQGLMQVMPLHGLENPFNARANVMKGAEILSSYINAAGGNLRLGLAYYNAGPNADQDLLNQRMAEYSDPILDLFRGR